MQPGGDGGVAAEAVGGAQGGHEGVLDGVRGLLAVARRAQGDGPQPVPVAAHDLAEGVRVARDVRGDELGVGPRVLGSRPVTTRAFR